MTTKKKSSTTKGAPKSAPVKLTVRGPDGLRKLYDRDLTPKPVEFINGKAQVSADLARKLVEAYDTLTLEGE